MQPIKNSFNGELLQRTKLFVTPEDVFFSGGIPVYHLSLVSKWNLEPNLSFTNVILKGILIE